MTGPWCLLFGHHWGHWQPLGYAHPRWSRVRLCRNCGKGIYA